MNAAATAPKKMFGVISPPRDLLPSIIIIIIIIIIIPNVFSLLHPLVQSRT